MKGADGKVIGTLDLNIEYEAGDGKFLSTCIDSLYLSIY